MFGKTQKNATDHSHQKYDRKNPGHREKRGAEAIKSGFVVGQKRK